MKKTLLFFALTFFSISLITAQEKIDSAFSKKDIFISGSIGYNKVKQDDFKNSSFTFNPSIGYFISKNISLDGGLIFSTADVDNSQLSSQEQRSFGGVLGATYFFTPSKQFSFSLGLHGRYQYQKLIVQNSTNSKANTFNVFFSPGINYFVSKSFALTASTGTFYYTTSKRDSVDSDRSNQFGFNLNLSNVNFGVIYKL